MRATSSAAFIAVTCALLSACAGTTTDSCATVDWYRQGYADGTRTPYSIVDQHVARCGAFGVKPDAERYQKGWSDARWDVEHRFK